MKPFYLDGKNGSRNKIFHYIVLSRCETDTKWIEALYVTENVQIFEMAKCWWKIRARKKMNVVDGWSTVKRLKLQIGLPNALSQMSLMRIQLLSVWQSYTEIARHLVFFTVCVDDERVIYRKRAGIYLAVIFFSARAVAIRF